MLLAQDARSGQSSRASADLHTGPGRGAAEPLLGGDGAAGAAAERREGAGRDEDLPSFEKMDAGFH